MRTNPVVFKPINRSRSIPRLGTLGKRVRLAGQAVQTIPPNAVQTFNGNDGGKLYCHPRYVADRHFDHPPLPTTLDYPGQPYPRSGYQPRTASLPFLLWAAVRASHLPAIYFSAIAGPWNTPLSASSLTGLPDPFGSHLVFGGVKPAGNHEAGRKDYPEKVSVPFFTSCSYHTKNHYS